MNRKDLYESIGEVEETMLERSEKNKRGSRKPWWIMATAAVLLLGVAGGIFLKPGQNPMVPAAYALEEAVYPSMAPYPDETLYIDPETGEFDNEKAEYFYEAWKESLQAMEQEQGYADGLEPFFSQSISQFLSGNEGKNQACSPLNVYMALGMLAETTEGESRQQILDLIGVDSMETLRAQVQAVWKAHYQNDRATTSILASSLWLNEDVPLNRTTLKTLAETYYASSYQGKMGSEELNQAFRTWLNEQTGGLLEDQIKSIQLKEETILTMAATIYFRAKWAGEFEERDTRQDTFHGLDGAQTCDFMHHSGPNTYYWGDGFGAVGKTLENGGGTMWFLLPDEDSTVEALLQDPEAMAFLLSNRTWEKRKDLIVNLSLPKFDITSQLDLRQGLEELGVTDVFDEEVSDFSPLTQEMEGIFLSQAQHDVRVAIDEKGVTAAAYTVMIDCASAAPLEEEMDVVLDRPFLFAVVSEDGLPLFVGTVYDPA